MSARDTEEIERGEYSDVLGRRVTVHECDCGILTRHTVLGEKTLKCDYCGVTKLGV